MISMDAQTANSYLAFSAAFAALAGPIAAVLVTLFWERSRRKRERRENVLQTLLATRGRAADPSFSWAIRTIPLYFHENISVQDAHRDFMNAARVIPTDEGRQAADAETARRLGTLISSILIDLGYKGLTSEQIESYTSEGQTQNDRRFTDALDSLPYIALNAKRSADAAEALVASIKTDPPP